MERELMLRELTHKDEGLDTARRVFYTLVPHATHLTTPDARARQAVARSAQTALRTTKLLGMLIGQLEENGILSGEQIDQLLLATLDHT